MRPVDQAPSPPMEVYDTAPEGHTLEIQLESALLLNTLNIGTSAQHYHSAYLCNIINTIVL